MRIIFMGTPQFAVPCLKILLDNNYPVVSVVTVPDKPAGRGQRISSSAIKQFATDRQLPVLQPAKLYDTAFIEQLRSLKPDLFVVVAFRILPPEVFTIPAQGAFNLHASLLPKYRGAAPINWAIINGEKETGVTTFFLGEKVDTGDLILQARVPIKLDETAGELYEKLSEVGAEIVLHTVRLIEMEKTVLKKQDNDRASVAPKIFKEQCMIDWNKTAEEVHNFIRGLSPKPCAFTRYNKTLFNIYSAKIVDDVREHKPGEILKTNGRLVVATSQGGIEVVEIQQEGKKKMSASEFLRGSRIKLGERFT